MNKNILCEKSISNSYKSAKKMVRVAKENKVVLMEGLMFRFHPSHRKILELNKKMAYLQKALEKNEEKEKTTKRKPGRPASRRSSQIVSLENELRRAVGTKVVIHANSKGAGRIVIPFGSPEEFERLLEFLKD